MSNLYAVTIFGVDLDWTVSTTVLVLMLAEMALVALALVAFILITVRKHALSKRKQNILVTHAAETEKDHSIVGISVDAAVVKRRFTVGEAFECEGLVVTASYNSEPSTETVTGYTVDPPAMDRPGRPNVTVRYGGYSTYYTIEVAEKEKARTCVGLSLDVSAVQRRFTAGEAFNCSGLIVRALFDREPLSEEVYDYTVDTPAMDTAGEKQVIIRRGDFAEYYTVEVLPAAERKLIGIDLDLDAVRADFTVGETFDSAGLGVIAHYDAEPYEERVTDFTVDAPDLSAKGMTNVVVHYGDYVQTYPVFVAEGRALTGITLDASVVRREFVTGEEFNCSGLIVTADYDAEPYTEELSDYEVEAPDLSEEGEKEVKVSYLGKTASYTVSVVRPSAQPAEDVIRYDRSFRAKVIQADEDTKKYYSAIKNELLSYKKVHDRLSWKRETYRASGDSVAKIGFRGNTLCLFLPLDPAEFAETRYKVEDASANKSSEDTPCLFRIKNEKRLRLSIELIARVMEERGIVRTDRPEEDYTEPYQGTDDLIAQGLIREKLTTKAEEDAFFSKK